MHLNMTRRVMMSAMERSAVTQEPQGGNDWGSCDNQSVCACVQGWLPLGSARILACAFARNRHENNTIPQLQIKFEFHNRWKAGRSTKEVFSSSGSSMDTKYKYVDIVKSVQTPRHAGDAAQVQTAFEDGQMAPDGPQDMRVGFGSRGACGGRSSKGGTSYSSSGIRDATACSCAMAASSLRNSVKSSVAKATFMAGGGAGLRWGDDSLLVPLSWSPNPFSLVSPRSSAPGWEIRD